ncbi:bifunctional diguanylate cyclase/phosphodiesterase [Anabaena sp. PCC 7108]|uniref:putative bifunctional diguanylate cyclase/phosphodiesterase n=1 Tax=Anabaena sp. PCC 7108 TaxID=163908 RepID=UPI000345F175|nr:bifunctional diguanylate cyclase/phosphodiesterase [Anabaena sp. PCC 7108]
MMIVIFGVFICLGIQLIVLGILNFVLSNFYNQILGNYHISDKHEDLYLEKMQLEIAERQRIQIELEKILALQQVTLESTTDGILIVDNLGKILAYNQNFLEMWHFSKFLIESENYSQILRLAIKQLENPKHYLHILKEFSQNPDTKMTETIFFKDGTVLEAYSQLTYISEKKIGRVWSFRNITAEKLASDIVNYQRLYDSLTNLPNRKLFKKILIATLAKVHKNSKLAVCFLDLDRFKKINETLGYALGDKLLQMVAQRLNECLREGDIVARWGGDEFTILLPEISDIKDVNLIQEQIFSAFKQGFKIENHHFNITPSIGIAIYPLHGEDAETLIKNADAALYCVQSQGRNNYGLYQTSINSQASELFMLENSLYNALERQELQVYYQPQINSSTGEITKMEALLRWQHPEIGLISPANFIPIAEETGLILPISEWVLKTACLQTKVWQSDLNLPSLSIAVNLSTRQFQQPNLVAMIQQILSETKLKTKYLELELTETAAMQDVELTKQILSELGDIGITISIDDFGTGYSSLSYLQDFPIHSLKIDRSFVCNLTNSNSDSAIITAIIALANELNLAVVAEGVETEEQFELLRLLNCEVMQGYLFSYPLSAEDATSMLKEYQPKKVRNSFLVG